MKSNLNETQPALLRGGAGALIAAVLALLVSFGLPITDAQQSNILTVVAIAGPILAGLWIKPNVWSPASHKAAVANAREQVVDRRAARPAKKPRP